MSQNNADVCQCSYFELELPVLTQNQQQLREIFKELPLISYRKGKSINEPIS